MNRGLIHWVAFLLSAIAVLSVAVAIQSAAELWGRRWDLTLQRQLSLSEYGAAVLAQLEGPLQIDYYYRRGDHGRARDLLDLLTTESRLVHVELIDIDRNPQRAKLNRVKRFDRAVLHYQDRESVTPAATEEALIGGIAQIVTQERPVLYLLGGHGERTTRVGYDDQIGRAGQILRSDGYAVRPLSLLQTPEVPVDAAAVVIAGPETDFVEREIRALDGYLRGGGSVLVLVDPVQLPALEGWIAVHGLRLADDVVIDRANRFRGSDGTTVLVPDFRKTHPMTKDLENPAVLGRARGIRTLDGTDGAPDAAAQVVVRTEPASFLARDASRSGSGAVEFDAATDREGPIGVVGVSLVRDAGDATRVGRLVVVGDADFASDNFIALLGNKDFLTNVVGWLTEREMAGARVQPGIASLGPLSPVYVSERLFAAILWTCAVIEPGLVLLLGIAVVLGRRRRR